MKFNIKYLDKRVDNTSKLQSFYNNVVISDIVINKSITSPNGGMTKIDLKDALNHNKDGKDVYFIANKGGSKLTDITHFNVLFVDCDAGRDANGNYHKLSVVKKYKDKVRFYINSLKSNKLLSHNGISLEPSYVVETRNGYQIYFLFKCVVNTRDNYEKYKILQNKLSNLFTAYGADIKVRKPNQLLRLPGFNWCKKWCNLPEYLVKINETLSSGKIYNIDNLAKHLENTTSILTAKKSNQYSYIKASTVDTNSGYVVSDTKTKIDSKLSEELCEYLEEINKILYYSNHKFLAKQALVLFDKIQTQLTLS